MDGDDSHEPALDALAAADDEPPTLLQELVYSLETVSMGTHQLLYFSARQYASEYIDCTADDLPGAAAELGERFDSLGVGTLELVDGDPPELTIADNAIVANAPETGRRMCYFIAGYIAGFMEGCLEDTFVVNETACMADGADACTFRLEDR